MKPFSLPVVLVAGVASLLGYSLTRIGLVKAHARSDNLESQAVAAGSEIRFFMKPENPDIFPREPLQYSGFTLRDLLAAKAMQAMVTRSTYGADAEDVAKASYQIADAMLKAREQ